MPFYRIVVADNRTPIKGRFIERVGHYNSLSNPKEVKLSKERIEYWISVGAIPSQTAARLFSKNGIKDAEKHIKERVLKKSNAELKAAEASLKAEEEKKLAAEEAAKAAIAAKELAAKEATEAAMEGAAETSASDPSPVADLSEDIESEEVKNS